LRRRAALDARLLSEHDGSRRDVLAGHDAAAAVAVPLALAGIKDRRGRDGAPGRADTRHDLVVVLRLDLNGLIARELDGAGPDAGLRRFADGVREFFEGDGVQRITSKTDAERS